MAQDGDSSYHVRDRFRKELLVITVADILALPAFEQVQPLVLCEGAELREVHNVGILDCAPDKDGGYESYIPCLLYTSPSPRDRQKSRMPSSA